MIYKLPILLFGINPAADRQPQKYYKEQTGHCDANDSSTA